MLIGQRRAETMLARAVAHERVSHAYLFLGPAGLGKTTAAYLFAQAINCDHLPEAPPNPTLLQPCGECLSCRRIAAKTHPDVTEIQPGSKSKQNISIEQAREIRQNTVLRPKLARRKVYIIPQAERIHEEAQNTLLKTIEEPSETVCIILCTSIPALVLPTIHSRCQSVRFGLSPRSEISAALEAVGTPSEEAEALAAAAGGRPGVALAWAKQPAVLQQRHDVIALFRQALALQAEGRVALGAVSLKLGEQLVKLGKSVKESEEDATRTQKVVYQAQLETALSLVRDRMIVAMGGEGAPLQNRELLADFAQGTPLPVPGRALQDVTTIREALELLERNVTPLLVFERMFWALICGPVAAVPRLFEEDRL